MAQKNQQREAAETLRTHHSSPAGQEEEARRRRGFHPERPTRGGSSPSRLWLGHALPSRRSPRDTQTQAAAVRAGLSAALEWRSACRICRAKSSVSEIKPVC